MIRRDNSRESFEGPTPRCFNLHAQPTPLVIGESDSMAFAQLLVHPNLLDEIVNDLLLISVDPTCYKEDDGS